MEGGREQNKKGIRIAYTGDLVEGGWLAGQGEDGAMGLWGVLGHVRCVQEELRFPLNNAICLCSSKSGHDGGAEATSHFFYFLFLSTIEEGESSQICNIWGNYHNTMIFLKIFIILLYKISISL